VLGLLFLLRGDAGGRGGGRKEEGRQVHAAPRALARAVIRQSASERATWAAGVRHGAKQPASSLHSAPHCPPSARAAGVALSPPRGHDETRRRQARRHGVVFPFPFTLSSTTRRSPSLSVSSGSDRAFPPRRLTGTGRPAGSPVPGVRPPPFRASLTSTRQ
jgi:hypothetical protein